MPANPSPDPRTLDNPSVWVDRYGDYLYRFALARINDPAVAEDLVQETFLAALKARRNFQMRATVKTWLTAILKHKIIDCLRKRRREPIIDNEAALDHRLEAFFNASGHWIIHPSKWKHNPVKHYEQKEFLDVLFDCLTDLPRRMARIFMLREMEGMPTEEICQQMEISATNCWTMLYRARSALRRCLELNWFGRGVDNGV
ncbi:MAG: sigma-70 family RNA polymerase sigma factor [Desulfobacterales bacterium]|nr:sigma-70 family RNA polymerase sigma factor [Desulfobacterales bacterium]